MKLHLDGLELFLIICAIPSVAFFVGLAMTIVINWGKW